MEKKIIIAGSGGQGILFLGRVLAFTSTLEGKEVTWFPSYGAEIRGGTANCTVIISDDMIGSPVVSNPDILIILNKASLARFQTRLIRKGRMFFDSSLIRNPHLRNNIEPIPVPATRLAGLIGNTKSANMVMLGALIAKTNILKKSSIFQIFENRLESGENSNVQININSVAEGINYIENTQSKNI